MVDRFGTALLAGVLCLGLGASVAARAATAVQADRANPSGGLQKPPSTAEINRGPSGEMSPEGNLDVSVPPVPSQRALPGLCRAFLRSDEQAKRGNAFEVLVGATGGNLTATSAWCATYLTLWTERETRDN